MSPLQSAGHLPAAFCIALTAAVGCGSSAESGDPSFPSLGVSPGIAEYEVGQDATLTADYSSLAPQHDYEVDVFVSPPGILGPVTIDGSGVDPASIAQAEILNEVDYGDSTRYRFAPPSTHETHGLQMPCVGVGIATVDVTVSGDDDTGTDDVTETVRVGCYIIPESIDELLIANLYVAMRAAEEWRRTTEAGAALNYILMDDDTRMKHQQISKHCTAHAEVETFGSRPGPDVSIQTGTQNLQYQITNGVAALMGAQPGAAFDATGTGTVVVDPGGPSEQTVPVEAPTIGDLRVEFTPATRTSTAKIQLSNITAPAGSVIRNFITWTDLDASFGLDCTYESTDLTTESDGTASLAMDVGLAPQWLFRGQASPIAAPSVALGILGRIRVDPTGDLTVLSGEMARYDFPAGFSAYYF